MFAQKCREAAGCAGPAEARDLLLEIANRWDALADLVERAELLVEDGEDGGAAKPH